MTDELERAAEAPMPIGVTDLKACAKAWRVYAERHGFTGSGDRWALFGDGFDSGVAHARAAEPAKAPAVDSDQSLERCVCGCPRISHVEWHVHCKPGVPHIEFCLCTEFQRPAPTPSTPELVEYIIGFLRATPREGRGRMLEYAEELQRRMGVK